MSRFIKVQHSEHLFRDNKSGAIVNNNQTEYQMYMKRVKARENNLNQMKDMCREINNLKAELFEIKDILKTLCDKGNK
jgi:hypothetical protein|tara:strand:- start:210 stop:443 length:234 start_codon:yes stop_codon:yes gene_type:complete